MNGRAKSSRALQALSPPAARVGQQGADSWKPAQPRNLTLEERAQLEKRSPFEIANADYDRATQFATEILDKSPRQLAREERARRVAKAKADLESDRAMLEDRAEIDSLQSTGMGNPLSQEFWAEVQGGYDNARARLAELERMSPEPTYREICWATEWQRIAAATLRARELPDDAERKQALAVAAESDLRLATWSRPDSVELLVAELRQLDASGRLAMDTFDDFVRSAMALLTNPLYGGTLVRGEVQEDATPKLRRVFANWSSTNLSGNVLARDHEGLLRKGLTAMGTTAAAARDLFAFLGKRVQRQA